MTAPVHAVVDTGADVAALDLRGPVSAEFAFEIELRDGDCAGHYEIDDAGGGEYGEKFEVLADDLLRCETLAR